MVKHISASSYYIVPLPHLKKLTRKVFFDNFTMLLEEFAVYTTDSIIMGDFNIHVDMSDPIASCFHHIIDSTGLKQYVMGPTHSAWYTLHLVITRGKATVVCDVTTSAPGISDHLAISISLGIQKPPTITKQIQYCKTKPSMLAN